MTGPTCPGNSRRRLVERATIRARALTHRVRLPRPWLGGPVVVGFQLVCPDCQATSMVFGSETEAYYFVAVHDRMLHAGHPTSGVTAAYAPQAVRS